LSENDAGLLFPFKFYHILLPVHENYEKARPFRHVVWFYQAVGCQLAGWRGAVCLILLYEDTFVVERK
jgi:hypothetical protein